MLRRHVGAVASKEVRFDVTSAKDENHLPLVALQHEPSSSWRRRDWKGMLIQLFALLGFCLVYVYVVSFVVSFSSTGSLLISSRTLPGAVSVSTSSKPLSLEAARKLPANATGTIALQESGTLYFPDSCHPHLCILSLKGSKGPGFVPNQDHSLIVEQPTQILLALFDGHGDQGHLASSVAVRDLPFRILQPLQPTVVSKETEISEQQKPLLRPFYTQAFLSVDAGPISRIPFAGTTGIVVHYDIPHQRLVLASVGDSTCLVVQGSKSHTNNDNSTSILTESIKHKPASPIERERIESKGGRIYIPANPAVESSRVLIPGPLGPESYALAMSRSLGDVEGKELGYLSAEPEVQVLDLKDKYTRDDSIFVVMASDGVFDVINKDALIQQLSHALNSNTLPETCQRLMNQAVTGWQDLTGGTYRDDISLLVAQMPMQ